MSAGSYRRTNRTSYHIALRIAMTTISSNSSWNNAPVSALTTIFTPPCNCVNKPPRLYGTTIPDTPLVYDWGETCSTWQLCDPVEYITWVCESAGGWIYSFSPGVCPLGWAAVGTTTSTEGNDVVTSAWCCPDGFTVDPNNESDCLSHVTTTTSALQWTSSKLPCGDTLDIPVGTTLISNFTIQTWYYTVAWRSADLSLFTPASAPLLMLERAFSPEAYPPIERSDCKVKTYSFPKDHQSTYTYPLGSCAPPESTSSRAERGSVATFGAPATAAITFAATPAGRAPPNAAATFGAAAPTTAAGNAAVAVRYSGPSRASRGFNVFDTIAEIIRYVV
ncbi:hypothetical protein Dda_5915 [Drechslerella dactyloides]|uniref:Uncharacterized protein n=1 Tax=Drechslerella dactyloides TaxID=74499 RepID=A0AAD6IUR2_DREDA|nr:hypothetical protein Dda_5915 [Drechslerella dactyloides]